MTQIALAASCAAFAFMNIMFLRARMAMGGASGVLEGVGNAHKPIVGMILSGFIGSITFVIAAVYLWGGGGFFSDLACGTWFLFPALAANQAPGFARNHRWWWSTTPVSTKWLGEKKTWAAYYAGPLFAIVALYLERAMVTLWPSLQTLGPIPFSEPLWISGIGFGLGATLFGDHAESFLKRRIGIASGESFWPFDQTDLILGASLIIGLSGYWISIGPLVAFMVLMIPLHPAGKMLG